MFRESSAHLVRPAGTRHSQFENRLANTIEIINICRDSTGDDNPTKPKKTAHIGPFVAVPEQVQDMGLSDCRTARSARAQSGW